MGKEIGLEGKRGRVKGGGKGEGSRLGIKRWGKEER
jgi:hypothetical protein